MTSIPNTYDNCTLCPRTCLADRTAGKVGYCGQSDQLRIARAALHMWEEPCISGSSGSGAIFFCGCQLRCVFCQNAVIATSRTDQYLSCSSERLIEHFFRLKEEGANNINLVTGDHFIPTIALSIKKAKAQGFDLPFVYNTSSYVHADSIKMLDGLIDVYLPDLKYFDSALSQKYSHAPDYFAIATKAIAEMVRQTGVPVFKNKKPEAYLTASEYNDLDEIDYYHDETEILIRKGTIVRHLLLPGQLEDSKQVIRYLLDTYGAKIYISIMNQYTPMPQIRDSFPELGRKVRDDEYEALIDYAIELGIENGFLQDGDVASESFIPDFNVNQYVENTNSNL